jgi:hypothetical protein
VGHAPRRCRIEFVSAALCLRSECLLYDMINAAPSIKQNARINGHKEGAVIMVLTHAAKVRATTVAAAKRIESDNDSDGNVWVFMS